MGYLSKIGLNSPVMPSTGFVEPSFLWYKDPRFLQTKGNAMAQKVQVILTSDLSDGPADTTVTFSYEGKTYEIDMTTKEAEKFHTSMQFYVDHARKVGGKPSRSTAPKSDVDPAAVRAWAASNGIEVNARGRISKDVVEKFKAAGN